MVDAIKRLARDPELRHRLGAHNRKRAVEQFSWNAIAQRTIELYRSLVERRAAKEGLGLTSAILSATKDPEKAG